LIAYRPRRVDAEVYVAKGVVQVPVMVGGVAINQTVSDNVEEFRYLPRGVAINDAVYMREGVVCRASAMVPEQTCIGLVINILNARWCQVLTQGIIPNYDTGMTPDTAYFLNIEAGKLTTAPPIGVGQRVQHIGIALNRTDLLINPDLRRFVVTGVGDRLAVHWNPQRGQFELGG
jgi:hypothetical protein